MRRAFLVLIISLAVAACGKKQAPTAPTPPPPTEEEKKMGEDKNGEPEAVPRKTDPCEGGESP